MVEVSLKKNIPGPILDIGGGGEGIIGRIYGASVTAIDNRPEELAESPAGPVKLVADARKMPFSDGSFPSVTAFFTFMYLEQEDQLSAFQEITRVLAPNGKFYLWDAEIETAFPFLIDLKIDANGEEVNTTYGIYKENARQNGRHFIRLAKACGLELIEKHVADHWFYLVFQHLPTTGGHEIKP